MFTGLIEEVGKIISIKKGTRSCQVSIACQKVLEGLKAGDSVATNGVCLTVVRCDGYAFTADIMPETLKVSSLGKLLVGTYVNLERALCIGDRLGGHFVSGHIDCVGLLIKITKDDNATKLRIKPPVGFMKYIVEKGSITIEGVSLTVSDLGKENFEVSIIPMTKAETTLLTKKTNDLLNLEGDIIGKYVYRMAQVDQQDKFSEVGVGETSYGHTLSFLKENGFA